MQPLDPNNPVETLQWGQTSVRVGIAGWAPVVNGVCDAENTVLGPVIYTPESQDTELCMLGQITPASLTVTKLVEDMPDAEFTFELVEQDQGQDPLSDDTSNRTEFSIETANARGDENLGSIEPGLYRLDEIDVPAGYEMTDLSCINAATEESILTEDGLLDIDSGVAASCVVTNGPRTTADLTLVKSVDGGSAEATAWILSAEGPTPISGTSGSAGVTSAKVQPGTYTLAESGGPDGYEQTDLACTAGNDTVPVEGEQITLSVGQERHLHVHQHGDGRSHPACNRAACNRAARHRARGPVALRNGRRVARVADRRRGIGRADHRRGHSRDCDPPPPKRQLATATRYEKARERTRRSLPGLRTSSDRYSASARRRSSGAACIG